MEMKIKDNISKGNTERKTKREHDNIKTIKLFRKNITEPKLGFNFFYQK